MIKGSKHSGETILRMRKAALVNGSKPPSRLGISSHPNSRKNSPFVKGHKINLGKKQAYIDVLRRISKLRGQKRTDEQRKRISVALKGHTSWMKGLSGLYTEEKSFAWKGNDVGYGGVHMWVKKWLGKPNKCSVCGKVGYGRQMHWANKDHKYRRDLTDWLRLCVECHRKYDKQLIKSI